MEDPTLSRVATTFERGTGSGTRSKVVGVRTTEYGPMCASGDLPSPTQSKGSGHVGTVLRKGLR